MIKVYRISNLKVIYNSWTEEIICLESPVDVNVDDDFKELDCSEPIFSANALTSQERYLLKLLLASYDWNEKNKSKYEILGSLEANSQSLMDIILELNEQLIESKNECAALEAEISELRQSKLEFERIKKEDEYS